MAKQEYFSATGKRKTAVARAYLKPGKGDFKVNNRSFEDYFPAAHLKSVATRALSTTKLDNQMDILVNVRGGGYRAQLEAIRHAIAKALLEYNSDLRSILKKASLLSRDARKKERKKYGQKGARARFQFSKR